MSTPTHLSLTLANGDGVFTIDESLVIFIESDTLGSLVSYAAEKDGIKRHKVCSDKPADLATMSTRFMAITAVGGLTKYVNIDRIDGNPIANSTGMGFFYDQEGQHNIFIQTTDSATTFYTNLYTKEGRTVYTFDDANATNDTFSLAAAHGDKTSSFTAGVIFTVFGSSTTTTNGIYKVSSSTYSGGKTVISVNTASKAVPVGTSETGSLYIQ